MSTAKKPKLKFKLKRELGVVKNGKLLCTHDEREALEKSLTHGESVVSVLVLPADPESVEALVDRFIEITRDQERRCDEGWEPGVGDIAKEYLAALGFKAKGRKP